MVQVEVRKKRVINPGAADNSVKLDETTAMKLKLIAEAKEHEARRRQEEEEKERRRQEEREQEEKERLARLAEENAKKAEIIQDIKAAAKNNVPASDVEEKSFKSKEKKSKDYDDDEDASAAKKFHKAPEQEKSREDAFEQDRKKVTKRSFEPQRRGGKVSLHNIMGAMMTMMIMVSVGLAAVSKRNSLSLFSRFNRRKRLLKKLSFLRLLRFRNWLTVWPKRVPMLLKN